MILTYYDRIDRSHGGVLIYTKKDLQGLISDHNILSISMCNKSKLDGDMGRENPYSNKTYEYVIDHESTEWKDLYDFFDEGHIDENSDAEKQLDD